MSASLSSVSSFLPTDFESPLTPYFLPPFRPTGFESPLFLPPSLPFLLYVFPSFFLPYFPFFLPFCLPLAGSPLPGSEAGRGGFQLPLRIGT